MLQNIFHQLNLSFHLSKPWRKIQHSATTPRGNQYQSKYLSKVCRHSDSGQPALRHACRYRKFLETTRVSGEHTRVFRNSLCWEQTRRESYSPRKKTAESTFIQSTAGQNEKKNILFIWSFALFVSCSSYLIAILYMIKVSNNPRFSWSHLIQFIQTLLNIPFVWLSLTSLKQVTFLCCTFYIFVLVRHRNILQNTKILEIKL